jgi:hypothetical protein
MKIPTQVSSEGISGAGSTAQFGPSDAFGAGRGLTLLGEGLRQASSGAASAASSMNQMEQFLYEKKEQQKRQDEALEITSATSNMRKDWAQRLKDYQDNPSANQLEVAQKEYSSYVSKMVEQASSPRVKELLQAHAAEFEGTFIIPHTYSLQAVTRQKEFAATLDKMFANAEDSIYVTASLGELAAQKQILAQTIDEARATGRLRDPETMENLKQKVNGLSVAWAQAALQEHPDWVIKAARGEDDFADVFEGVPAHVRATLENRARHVIDSKSEVDKLKMREILEADKAQRLGTGIPGAFNYEVWKAAFGETAANSAKRELETASKLFDTGQKLLGATVEEINGIIKDAEPKADPNTSTFHEEDAYYKSVLKMAHEQFQSMKNDPFTYFQQDPAYAGYIQDYEEHPSPQTRKAMLDVVLDAQRRNGLEEYELKAMPKAEAEKFVTDFNGLLAVGSKADGVREKLLNFYMEYGDYSHIALRQISEAKGGDKVSPKINPLLWHANNPTMFQAVLDSIRKDTQEVEKRFKDTKERVNFYQDVNTDPNFLKYANTVIASNNSAEAASLVNGVRETYTAFARDYYLNGGKLKDASKLFFEHYAFGEHNGVTYARPRAYTDSRTKEVHTVSDQMVAISDEYLRNYPLSLDVSRIDPKTLVNSTKFSESETKNDMKDALEHNSFWATTEDETGVYLFTRGTLLGQPRQVRFKDGSPVRVNFEDTYIPPAETLWKMPVQKPKGFNPNEEPNYNRF